MVRPQTRRVDLFLVAIFFVPIAYLFLRLGSVAAVSSLDWSDILWSVNNSVLQSVGSSFFNIAGGFIIAVGLQSYSLKTRKKLETLLLLPAFLPAIFSIVLVFSVLQPFPMGIVGIIIVHTFTTTGFAAVVISQLFSDRIGKYLELSKIFGFSSFRTWGLVISGVRRELLFLFLSLVITHFSSFSVPLTVGGGNGTTLEVLIYEKIRITQDFSGALWLSLFQSIFLGVTYFFMGKLFSQGKTQSSAFFIREQKPLMYPTAIWALAFPILFFLTGIKGLSQVLDQPQVLAYFLAKVPVSILYALVVGFLTFLFLWISSFSFSLKGLRVVNSINPPSYSLVGLIVAFMPMGIQWPFVFSFAFFYLIIISLLRLGWVEKLESLRAQVEIAEVFGLSSSSKTRNIIWPQVADLASLLTALSVIWTLGDFAFSRIFFFRDETMAMVVHSLLSSYRVDLAQGYAFLLSLVSMLVFYLVRGGIRVFSQRFI